MLGTKILNLLRAIAASLFTYMSFAGSFKEASGVAFGDGSIIKDYTFLATAGIVVCFLLIFFLEKPIERQLMWQRALSVWPLVALAGYLIVSQIFLGSPAGWSKVSYFLVFDIPACVLFASLMKGDQYLRSFLFFIVLSAFFLTSVAFAFKAPNPFLFLQTGDNTARSWTYIIYGALACSAALICFVWSVETKFFFGVRFLLMALSAYLFMGVIYSGERGSILFVPLILLIYFFASGKKVRWSSKGFLFAGIFIILSAFIIGKFIESDFGENFRNRLRFLKNSDTAELDSRLDLKGGLTIGLINMLGTNPVFGLGPGNYFGYNIGGYPHNVLFETFGELGFTGGGVFVWILIRSFRGQRLFQKRYPSYIASAFLVVFLLYFFRTFKTGNLSGSRYFWILCSAYLCISSIKNHPKMKVLPREVTFDS